MMADERIIEETDEWRDVEVTSAGWPDTAGSWRSVRREWKAGSEQAELERRRAAAVAKLEQIAGASSLTNAQAQAAVKFQARVLAKVLPFLDLDPDEV